MKNTQKGVNLNEKVDNENVLEFRKPDLVISGAEPPNENWLKSLAVGTCFLCRPLNDKSAELAEHHLVHKADLTSLLLVRTPDDRTLRRHVDTLRFSRANELIEVLGVTVMEEPTEEGENPHGNGDNV